MAKRSLHQRLTHSYRTNDSFIFGESRRVFAVENPTQRALEGSDLYNDLLKNGLKTPFSSITADAWALKKIESENKNGINAGSLTEFELGALLQKEEITQRLTPSALEALQTFMKEVGVARRRQEIELGPEGIQKLFDEKYFEKFQQYIDWDMGFDLEASNLDPFKQEDLEKISTDFRAKIESVLNPSAKNKRLKKQKQEEREKRKEAREKRAEAREKRAEELKLTLDKEGKKSIENILNNSVAYPEEFIKAIEKEAEKISVGEEKIRKEEYERRLEFEKRLAAKEKKVLQSTSLKLQKRVKEDLSGIIDVERAATEAAQEWARKKAKCIQGEMGKREHFARQELIRWKRREAEIKRGSSPNIQDQYRRDQKKNFEDLAEEEAKHELFVARFPKDKKHCLKKLGDILKALQKEKINTVVQYLEEEKKKLEDELILHAHLFNAQAPGNLFERFSAFQRDFSGLSSLSDQDQKIAQLEALRQQLGGIEEALKMQLEDLKEAEENKESLKQGIRESAQTILDFHQKYPPEKIEALRTLAEFKLENYSPDSDDHLRCLHLIENLKIFGELFDSIKGTIEGGEAEMEKIMETFCTEDLLNKYSHLSQQAKDLKVFEKEATVLEALEEEATALEGAWSVKARNAMEAIKKAPSLAEIELILIKQLGQEHVQLTDRFTNYPEPNGKEKDLSKYTTAEGGMVFYQRAGEWKIIIDKHKFRNGNDALINLLKAQVTHELLHVELEHWSDQKKDEVLRLFTTDPHWLGMKAAFERLGKKSPDPSGEWSDYNIVHELYAMQNDLGNKKIPQEKIDTAKDPTKALYELNNLYLTCLFKKFIKDKGYDPDKELNKIEAGWAASNQGESKVQGWQTGITGDDGVEGLVEIDPETPQTKESSKEGREEAIMSKGNYQEFKNHIGDAFKKIEELRKKPALAYIPQIEKMLKLLGAENRKTYAQNEYLKTKDSPALAIQIDQRLKHTEADLANIENTLNQAGYDLPGNGGKFIQSLFNNTRGISLGAIAKAITDLVKNITDLKNNKEAIGSGALRAALLGNSRLGRQSSADLNSAEGKQVSDYQEPLKQKSDTELLKQLKSNPGRLELKAILRTLADRGRINWVSPDLWNVLNRLQSRYHFSAYDQELIGNPQYRKERLKAAFTLIFDSDEFTTLDRQNESSYESKKAEADRKLKTQGTTLILNMERLLQQKIAGNDTVDPIEYEAIIEHCVRDGKGEPDNAFFHLITGMATGLLNSDRAQALSNQSMRMPQIDWLLGIKPSTQEHFKEICQKYFPTAFDQGQISSGRAREEFRKFVSLKVNSSNDVLKRTNKAIDERLDNDHMRFISPNATANDVERLLSPKGGRVEIKPNGSAHHITGLVEHFETTALYMDEAQFDVVQKFSRLAANAAMSIGILSGAVWGEKQGMARYDDMNSHPQEAGMGFHGDWNIGAHDAHLRTILNSVDNEFFRSLLSMKHKDPNTRAEAMEELRAILAKKGVPLGGINNVEDVYVRLDNVVRILVSNKNKDKLKADIARGANVNALRAKLGDSVPKKY